MNNKLTQAEIVKVFALYPSDTKFLKPFHHMSTEDVLEACIFYDKTGSIGAMGKTISVIPKQNEPMIRQVIFGAEWPFMYNLDLRTGAITLFRQGRPFNSSHKQLLLSQWYCHRYFAIPLYFGDGHWANTKTALELGIAVPDRGLLEKLLNKKFKGDQDEIEAWYFDKRLLGVDLDKLETMDQVIAELKDELNL